MEAEIQKLLDAFADLREKANVDACFGEPVTTGERVVIPVAQVSYGFGMGIGQGPAVEAAEEEAPAEEPSPLGGGGGGGTMARPFATIEVTPEHTRVIPIIDQQKVALVGALVGGWIAFWLFQALAQIFGKRT